MDGDVLPGSSQALISANSPDSSDVFRAQLALTLFVFGILTDDANDASPVDYLAFITDLLNGCTDLHTNS